MTSSVDEQLRVKIEQLIDRADAMVMIYEAESADKILESESPYEDAIEIYKEAIELAYDNGWNDQLDVYQSKVSSCQEKLIRDDKMRAVDKMATNMKNQMRKGFLSVIIMYSLRETASYGYKIQQDIGELTRGTWSPTLGTIYKNLSKLSDKGLIQQTEDAPLSNAPPRVRREYKITDMGADVLELVIDDLKELIKTMRAVLFTFYGLDVDYEPDELLW